MKGRIGLFSGMEGVRADVHMERGFVERIFPALSIEFPLEGEASGNFEIRQRGEDIRVKGDFAGSRMNFIGQELKEVSGKLEWGEDSVSLSELQFGIHEGVLKGDIAFGFSSQEFDIDMLGEGIDLSSLYSGMTGNLSFLLNGKGVFGQDFALGPFEIEDLYHSPFQKTQARGLAQLNRSDGTLGLDLMGNFLPGQNYFHVSFSIPLIEDMILVGIRGSFNNLDLLFPWIGKGAEGRVNYLGEVKGPKLSPQVKGAVDFKGSVFPVPGFAHAFRDYSGLMFVDNNLLTFRSLQAKMGGGDVQGDGELKVGPGGYRGNRCAIAGREFVAFSGRKDKGSGRWNIEPDQGA